MKIYDYICSLFLVRLKMKAYKTLLFIAGVFLLMGLGWVFFPAEGVDVGNVKLRFMSMERSLENLTAEKQAVDVDAVLENADKDFELIASSMADTLDFYRNFLFSNPNRISVPGGDWRFFDSVFSDMESARRKGRIVRVVHYGDSQIEMDRISADIRDGLQKRFGGNGTGMFPALSNVPSGSVYKGASGGMVHYTMYGDSTTRRAPHNRYGVLAQLTSLSGGGTVSMRASKATYVLERTKQFTRVSLLMGRNSDGFKAKVYSDTTKLDEYVCAKDSLGAVWLTWQFPRPVSKAVLSMKGSAEIYGIATDGDSGVAVDNVPLRGSSGTIFSRIDKNVMRRSMALDNTRLIILQFGGNYMPSISSTKMIEGYMEKIAAQIAYFKEVAPQAKIIFIGPSDMGKSVNGKIVTWPRLPELVDALRTTALNSGAAFYDLYQMMGGENSMREWVRHNPPYAGPDYIHFTTKGARIAGEAFTRSLLVYYDFYRLRKTIPEETVRKYMRRND